MTDFRGGGLGDVNGVVGGVGSEEYGLDGFGGSVKCSGREGRSPAQRSEVRRHCVSPRGKGTTPYSTTIKSTNKHRPSSFEEKAPEAST